MNDNGEQKTPALTTLNFFDEGSPFLAHPLLTADRTKREIDFIESELVLPDGARLLDVGCGFGRHAIELARRGYDVVGIDPAPAMIAAAKENADPFLPIDFRQAWGEEFVTETPFDAAICTFTSLGQISSRGENSGLVQRVFAALKPGGRFVVEVPQRDAYLKGLKPSEQFGEGQSTTAVSRQYDPQAQTVTEIFHLVSPKKSQTYTLRYRLYDQAGLFDLRQRAGFVIQAAYGDYEGAPLTGERPIMVVVGQRA